VKFCWLSKWASRCNDSHLTLNIAGGENVWRTPLPATRQYYTATIKGWGKYGSNREGWRNRKGGTNRGRVRIGGGGAKRQRRGQDRMLRQRLAHNNTKTSKTTNLITREGNRWYCNSNHLRRLSYKCICVLIKGNSIELDIVARLSHPLPNIKNHWRTSNSQPKVCVSRASLYVQELPVLPCNSSTETCESNSGKP
jgi:hypothetical protein